jgi:hypothetical protein
MHPEDLGDLGLVAEIRCMTNSLVDQEMRWGVGFGRAPLDLSVHLFSVAQAMLVTPTPLRRALAMLFRAAASVS